MLNRHYALSVWVGVLALSCRDAGAVDRPQSNDAPRTPGKEAKIEASRPLRAGDLPSSPSEIEPSPSEMGPCPAEMVEVSRVCIDRYEASLTALGDGGARTPHPYYQRPVEGALYWAVSEKGSFPQGYVSRVESASACSNAQKRLCTMREWQAACEGTQKTKYPYGNRWEPKRCNMDKPHLLSRLFGWDPHRWHYADFNDPKLNLEPGFLTEAGALAQCVSDVGAYDMVGNLHEWVSDDVDSELVARLENEGITRAYQPWSSGNGIFMGGFFSTHEQHGPGCEFTTIAHEPTYHDYSTGFRCCKDPNNL